MTKPQKIEGGRKWHLSRINQGYQMTRINGDSIECRELNWIEKIIYYFKIK